MNEPENDGDGDPDGPPKEGGGPWAKTSSGDADSITEDDDES